MKNVAALPSAPSPDGRLRLDLSEQLFLWGFRTMARHHRCGCPIAGAMRQAYGQFRVEDAVTSLDALIEVFASIAHTAIEIHSPNCPCVSESEACLLQAMAAAQSGDLEVAGRTFERWLPELAADWAMAPACGIARLFQSAGLILPRRDIGMTDLTKTAAKQHWSSGSNAIH